MELKDYALEYLRLGWSVIPIKKGDKLPHIRWKKYQSQLPTEEEVVEWFTRWPDASIAVITGKLSNLAVVDFDSIQGMHTFQAQVCDLPGTIYQVTGRKSGDGKQYFFTYPDNNGFKISNKAGHLIADVDIRGEGGYVVIPPSIHKSGNAYAWGDIDPLDMGLDDLCDMPPEAIEFFKDSTPVSGDKSEDREDWLNDILWGVAEGKRNDAAARYSGWLLNRNQGRVEVCWQALKAWNSQNRPPMPEKELRQTLDSIAIRNGSNKFQHETNIVVDYLEILNYPDGEKEYRLNVKGVDQSIILKPHDIQSPQKFELKLLILMDHLPALPRKITDWRNLINPLLKEAKKTYLSEEETNLSIISDMLDDDLKRGGYEPEDPEIAINRSFIVINSVIYVKLPVLMKKLEFSELKRNGRKEISHLLRLSGFSYTDKTVRLGNAVLKVWSKQYNGKMH